MSKDNIPTDIATDEMEVLGWKLKVHVLDDGRRVVDAADMQKLLAAFSSNEEEDDCKICEGCDKRLHDGDLVHRCVDGPVFCETCAPSWSNLLEQYTGNLDDLAGFVDRTPEELEEDRAAIQARVDAGDGDKKHVWPL